MLCQFAQYFPKSVASFLQRGQQLRRRFREETITDILMGNILALGGGSVIVDFPNEPVTGADMEWNFVNPDNKTFFQILLQAKRLYDNKKDWKYHSYKKLFYRSGPSKTLQVETLCNTALGRGPNTYPLYIFYNPERTCLLANSAGARKLDGVNLADAFFISKLAKVSTSKKLEAANKTVGAIYPSLFSLIDVFCPSNILPLGRMAFAPRRISIPLLMSFTKGGPQLGRPIPPRPDQVHDRLVEQRATVLKTLRDNNISLELPDVPNVSTEIPPYIAAIISRFENLEPYKPEPLNFWRITFVSANPRDELGRPEAQS
jgi:hypothetical protein